MGDRPKMVKRVRDHFLGPYRPHPDEILWANTVRQVGAACGGATAEEVVEGLWAAVDGGFDAGRLPIRVAAQVDDLRRGDLSEVQAIVLDALDRRLPPKS